MALQNTRQLVTFLGLDAQAAGLGRAEGQASPGTCTLGKVSIMHALAFSGQPAELTGPLGVMPFPT